VIGSQSAALQLRYLQTLTEIAVEKNSTIIFPLPLDLIEPVIQIIQRQANVSAHEPLNGTRMSEPPRLINRIGEPSPSCIKGISWRRDEGTLNERLLHHLSSLRILQRADGGSTE
jgi:hypothetical protein